MPKPKNLSGIAMSKKGSLSEFEATNREKKAPETSPQIIDTGDIKRPFELRISLPKPEIYTPKSEFSIRLCTSPIAIPLLLKK